MRIISDGLLDHIIFYDPWRAQTVSYEAELLFIKHEKEVFSLFQYNLRVELSYSVSV